MTKGGFLTLQQAMEQLARVDTEEKAKERITGWWLHKAEDMV